MSAKVIQLREVVAEESVNIGDVLRVLGYEVGTVEKTIKEEIEEQKYIDRETKKKRETIRHSSMDASIKGAQQAQQLIKRKEELEKKGKEPEEIAADAWLEMIGAYSNAIFELRSMYLDYLRLGYPPLPIMDDMVKRDSRYLTRRKYKAPERDNFYYDDFEGKGKYGDAFNYDDFKRRFDEKKLRNYMWQIVACIGWNR